MAIIQTPPPVFKIDVDEYVLRDAIDSNLSDYLKILVTDAAGYVGLAPKAGDLRIYDVDDTDNSDSIQFTCDDASGSLLQKTSQITDGNIWEIEASGTYSGASATVTINYFEFDIDGTTINDGAANAVTLQGINMDWDGITATAVALSNITGFYLILPSAGEYLSERGLQIVADKSVVSNNAIALETSRDITGTLLAAETFTNYANIMGQNVTHSGGNFILTNDAGVLQLNLNHDTTVACTNEDVFSASALDINITADVNVVSSDAQIDVSARAIDVAYALSETDGVMNLDATDIFRIDFGVAAGINVGDGGTGDLNMALLDGSDFVPAANITNNMNISGLQIDWSSASANDANASIYGAYIYMPYSDHSTASTVEGLYIIADGAANATNALKGIHVTKDASLTTAAAANISLTNYIALLEMSATNNDDGGFDITNSANVLEIDLSHTASATTAAIADTFSGTAIDIDIISTTDNNANNVLTTSARGLDILYQLAYDTAGTHYLAATDIARIVYTAAAGITSTGAYEFNMLKLDSGTSTINDANMSFRGIDIELVDTTDTDFAVFYGLNIDMPAAYQGTDPTAAIRCTGNGMIAEVCVEGDSALLISGAQTAAADWVSIYPSAATINTTATRNLLLINTNNWDINDGVTTPTIRGGFIDLSAHTETDVNNTTLEGLRIDMPDVSGYNAARALIATQGTAAIIEMLPETDELILLAGNNVEARNWLNIAPTAATINADININLLQIDIAAWTINDGVTTPEIRLARLDAIAGVETDTGNTTLYGMEILMPDMSAYVGGSGIRVTENTNDYIVDIVSQGNRAILVSGDSIEARNWVEIKPSAVSVKNLAGTINLLDIDTDNWTIDDDTSATVIQAMWINLDDMTETEVAASTLYGINIAMPGTLAGYVGGAGIYVEDGTQSVTIIDGTTALTVVGGIAVDMLDLTPTTNVDALDINLENNNWTSASAIDIDIGDWIGGSNIIDLQVSQAGTIATNATMINIDAGTNVTFTDGGAATQYFRVLNIDMSAITAANANMAGMYGINIVMPAAAHAAWGANKVSAIHATGNGNTFDALLGSGILLTMGEVGSTAIDLDLDVADANQTKTGIVITKDGTTAAVNSRTHTGIGLDIDYVPNGAAGGDYTVTSQFIDLSLAAAGTCTIDTTSLIKMVVSGVTQDAATSVFGIELDFDQTVNQAAAIFRGIELNLDGITDTSAGEISGMRMVLPATANGILMIADSAHADCAEDHDSTNPLIGLDFCSLTDESKAIDINLRGDAGAAVDLHGMMVTIDDDTTLAGTMTGLELIGDTTGSTSTHYGLQTTLGLDYHVHNMMAATDLTAIYIDAGTTNHTLDGSLIDIDLDIQGEYSNTILHATVDFDTDGMGFADTLKGIDIDINEVVLHDNGSLIVGYDFTGTAFATSRNDMMGFRATFDGERSDSDWIYGFMCDFTGLTISGVGSSITALNIDGSGYTHTNGTVIGISLDFRSAAVTTGLQYGMLLYVGEDTSSAIAIDAGSENHTLDGNIIYVDLDIQGNYSNTIFAGTIDFDTTGMAGTDACYGVHMDLNEHGTATAVNGAALECYYGELSGASGSAADLKGLHVVVDGTKDQGDTAKGIFVDLDLTVNNAAEEVQGIEVDISGITDTSSEEINAIKAIVSNGRNVAINANDHGTVSGRIEQGAPYFEDEFWARDMKDQWVANTVDGAGGITGAPASDLNGQVRFTTGNVINDETSYDWNDINCFQNTLRPTFECRVTLAQVDADTNFVIGLQNDQFGNDGAAYNQNLGGTEELIAFQMSTNANGSNNWFLHCQNSGVSTVDDSGSLATTSAVTLRFEFVSDTTVEWFINGTSQGRVTTNVPDAALNPIIWLHTDAAAVKYADIDYVKYWQDRS